MTTPETFSTVITKMAALDAMKALVIPPQLALDDECPARKQFDSKVWDLLKSMAERMNDTSLVDGVNNLMSEHKDLKSNYDALKNKYDAQENALQLLAARLSLLEKSTATARKDHENLTARSMNHNVIFTFKNDHEAAKEADKVGDDNDKCKSHAEKIIREKLEPPADTVSVVRAHRLGVQQAGKCRPIIARLTEREMVGKLLKLGKKLKDSGIYLNPQFPPNMTERRHFCREEYVAARTADIDAKLNNDRLYINNQLQRHLLPPNLPDTDLKTFQPVPLQESNLLGNNMINLRAFTAPVSCMEEVRSVYDSMLTRASPPPDSIVYAYRFSSPTGPMKQNFDSGTEGGTGFKLLREMQDAEVSDHMVVLGIWYKNRNNTSKGPGFHKMINDCLKDIIPG